MNSTRYSRKKALAISALMAAVLVALVALLLEFYGESERFGGLWVFIYPGGMLSLFLFGFHGDGPFWLRELVMYTTNFLIYTLIFYGCVRFVRIKPK